mgnify:CR=1 FL=1
MARKRKETIVFKCMQNKRSASVNARLGDRPRRFLRHIQNGGQQGLHLLPVFRLHIRNAARKGKSF